MRRRTSALLVLALTVPAAAQCPLQWQATNTIGHVNKLKRLRNGDIVAAGTFTSIDGVAAAGVARYNAAGWHAIGSGLPGAFDIFELPNGDLGALSATALVIWDGTSWQPGPPPPVASQLFNYVALPNGNLIAAGFVSLGPQNEFAQFHEWNGSSWQVIGTSFGGTGHLVAIDILPSGELVAAGDWVRIAPFGQIGGYNEVMKWDGALWHRVMDLPNPRCMLVARNGEVYAAGENSFVSTTPVSPCSGTSVFLDAFAMTDLPNGDIVTGGWTQNGNPAPFPVTVHRCDWNGSPYTELVAGASFPPHSYPFENMVSHDDGTIMATGPITIGGTASQLAYLRSTCPSSVTSTPTSCTGSSGPIILTATQPAWIGAEFAGQTTGFSGNAIAVNVLSLQTLSTPLGSLLPQGLPNCDLLVSPDVLTLAVPAAGVSNYSHAVPEFVALNGLNLHLQTLQIDPILGTTSWQASSSNRLTFTIGVF